jgi:glycosyltransferase involved in cell wall biosynthesis
VAKHRILFVVSGTQKLIGGHSISAITVAKELANRGYQVDVIINKPQHRLAEIQSDRLEWHYHAYSDNLLYVYLIQRPISILSTTFQHRYDCIVACDFVATEHSFLAVIVNGIPLIQIQAGGKLPHLSLLKLPGIIVFSEELLNGFAEKHNMPLEFMRLSPGRVDFSYFRNRIGNNSVCLGFQKTSKRILCVSRLTQDKAPAIRAVLEEIRLVAANEPIQLAIVGDGEAKDVLMRHANEIVETTHEVAKIWFTGTIRVDGEILRQADLVIGQGRTVVESIASGVPAAIAGATGYFGLITPQTFSLLAETNLTGRNISWRGSLVMDLKCLDEFANSAFEEVYQYAKHNYDVSRGADAIESILKELHFYYATSRDVRWKYLQAYFFRVVERFQFWLRPGKV